jgi:hypothetical protein
MIIEIEEVLIRGQRLRINDYIASSATFVVERDDSASTVTEVLEALVSKELLCVIEVKYRLVEGSPIAHHTGGWRLFI